MPRFNISWLQTRTIYRSIEADSVEEAIELAEGSPSPKKSDKKSDIIYDDFQEGWQPPCQS